MSTAESEYDTLSRRARALRRNIKIDVEIISDLIKENPIPTNTIVHRLNQEILELSAYKLQFAQVWDDLLDYCDIPEEVEPDKVKRENRIKTQEERWSKELTEINTLFKETNAKAQAYLEVYNGSTQNRLSIQPLIPTATSEIKLKPIKIPEFDGNEKKFGEFRDLYQDLVHKNPDFSNIQKMHRLKEALKGDAANLIRDFPISAEAYPEAWSFLNEWYDNKKSLIASHLDELFRIQRIKSPSQVRKLVLDFETTLRGLKSCEIDIDKWSVIMSYYLRSKLDEKTQFDWDMSITFRNRYPDYSELKEFLLNRVHSSTDQYSFKPVDKSNKAISSLKSTTNAPNSSQPTKKIFNMNSNIPKCISCPKGEQHLLIDCIDFRNKTPEQRWKIVKEAGLCLNCFCNTHRTGSCNKSTVCKTCSRKHHTMLHLNRSPKDLVKESSTPQSTSNLTSKINPDPPSQDIKTCSTSACSNNQLLKCIVLPTAVVQFKIGSQYGLLRVLLDSASEVSVISDKIIQRRRIPVSSSKSSTVRGIGGEIVCNNVCSLNLSSRYSSFNINVSLDVVPAYAIAYKLPTTSILLRQECPKLELADSSLKYREVDVILGAEYFEHIVLEDKLNIQSTNLRKTQFGWVTIGAIPNSNSISRSCFQMSRINVNENLRKFWYIEEAEVPDSSSDDRTQCEAHFMQTYSRESDGRFIVRLPTKSNLPQLDSTSMVRAKRTLLYREKQSDPDLRRAYIEFLSEYEQLGHMSRIPCDEISRGLSYYIPHHAVMKPDSTTTKVRIVFNASAHSANGLSLNDVLMVGPSIQSELLDILIRFRSYPVAFTADIAKMYRQILVHPKDRDLQRILWRNKVDDPIDHFRLNTITYGTGPASFLATKCLQILADEVLESYPVASNIIKTCFYVDDLLAGADSEEEAVEIQSIIHSTLMSGGFPLRKYASNSNKLLQQIPTELVEIDDIAFTPREIISVLGLNWNCQSDTLCIQIRIPSSFPSQPLTKRLMLSFIARIFDPIGILSPIVTQFKVLLQSLWKVQIGWDDQVTTSIAEKFMSLVADLPNLREFSVPRIYCELRPFARDLIGFCDASINSYCCVVYLRSISDSGKVECRLICAKSRVAPITQMTIHRLELLSAVLLTKVLVRVSNTLNINMSNVYAFSDSQVTLSWLAKPPETWQTFIANRVRLIQKSLSPLQWSYVNTKVNPADLPTRNLSVNQFIKSDLWLSGPQFLVDNFCFQPWQAGAVSILPELRQSKSCLVIAKPNSDESIFERYSTFARLRNITAHILRFRNNIDLKRLRCVGPFTAAEYEKAEFALIRCAQSMSFPCEIAALSNGKPLPKRSKLLSLTPFIDDFGILRVSGRLQNSKLPENVRHPIILLSRCKFIVLVIQHIHLQYFHANRNMLRAFVNNRFWLIGGPNNVIKSVIRHCVYCTRFHARTQTQLMGKLPIERITPSHPFTSIGTDFFGPFKSKCIKHRSVVEFKCHCLVIVCLSTRAVHLEVCSGNSLENFMDAFDRFCSRRGTPTTIFSDNGGAYKAASSVVAKRGIHWKFIPPQAPHMGGIWEAAVKAAKSYLLKATNGQIHTFETYSTVFSQIEAILNSRPIAVLREPSQDDFILTPGHFLTGRYLLTPENSNSIVLEEDDVHYHTKLKSNWEARNNLIRSFWRNWRNHYLNELHIRQKWQTSKPNCSVGAIVALKDNTLVTTNQWPLGRITKVFRDDSGIVRSVELSINGKLYVRPIVKIIQLPVIVGGVDPTPPKGE